ncbi:unnamed protein product [Psylliodes chrysocephalus]|uniref:Uncharacterized protein n=1 Tax=Psylliodes chrysocephalus TaxID=3402493 RepID=A0A9P0CSA6_9CUCU|nr:unnamed protein product [Psylliodes chrysocephala]
MSAISHLALALTGFYCHFYVKHNVYLFAPSAFLVVIINSLVSIWQLLGQPFSTQKVNNIYNITSVAQEILFLPLVTSAVLTKYDFLFDMVFCNIILSSIPVLFYIIDKNEIGEDLLDGITILNCFMLGLVSFMFSNLFGLAASGTYAMNYFHIRNYQGTIFGFSETDLYNYVLCVFAMCSVQAIK